MLMSAQTPGDLINYSVKLDLTPEGLAQYIDSQTGNETSPEVVDFLKSFHIGLKAYKIEYYTKNEKNQTVKASGLLMYPKRDYKLSTVVATHPTTDHRNNVPSNLSGTMGFGFILELSYALNGYIVMAPDYVGMGSGEGTHPYVHNDSEAAATLDFVKAANKVINQLGNIKRYNEYFLTGYSQGGHASMATLKRASQTNEVNFKYMFTGAGPFDLSYSTLQLGLLDKTEYPSSAFTASLIYSCKLSGYQVYNSSPNEIIAPNYQQLFQERVIEEGGGLDWGPTVWRNLYKPTFISAVTTNQNHPLRKCLKANDNYDWYNKTPSTFGYADPDRTVHPNSSKRAKSVQRDYYSWWNLDKYKIDDLYWGPLDHTFGVVPYIIAVNYKFNTLRSGGFFNEWAWLTSRNAENTGIQAQPISRSAIDVQLDPNIEILEATNMSQSSEGKRVSVSKSTLSELENGIYLLKISRENNEEIIPFVKKEPTVIEEREAVNREENGKLYLNLDASEVDHINILQDRKVIQEISAEQYAENGIDTKNLNGEYTFEIVAKDFNVQFNKGISGNASIGEDLKLYSQNRQITVISGLNIKEMTVFDASGAKVFSRENVTAKTATTKTLTTGLYIVNIVLENGKQVSQKHLVR